MTTTTTDPTTAVPEWRWSADERGNAYVAAELLARAAELELAPLPEDERRMSYEDALHHVRCHNTGTAERLERIARRMHTHGRGHWHTSWVLYGTDGAGCPCAPCTDARR